MHLLLDPLGMHPRGRRLLNPDSPFSKRDSATTGNNLKFRFAQASIVSAPSRTKGGPGERPGLRTDEREIVVTAFSLSLGAVAPALASAGGRSPTELRDLGGFPY